MVKNIELMLIARNLSKLEIHCVSINAWFFSYNYNNFLNDYKIIFV
jgi:hypothetical protein